MPLTKFKKNCCRCYVMQIPEIIVFDLFDTIFLKLKHNSQIWTLDSYSAGKNIGNDYSHLYYEKSQILTE